ncbi:hypothetical protein NDU88_002264 [Pleurodeles waltl]|uniref:Uncharacterized protein n=1 Tax=Pleurodeles waltl TaxID=8319 RepID=A0AAV7SCF6_PLEWA|nr:hypothetical protein NDU88_002264 [Pleurodeles waltl]
MDLVPLETRCDLLALGRQPIDLCRALVAQHLGPVTLLYHDEAKDKQSSVLVVVVGAATNPDEEVMESDGMLRHLKATLNPDSTQFQRILQAIMDTKTALESKIDSVSLDVELL